MNPNDQCTGNYLVLAFILLISGIAIGSFISRNRFHRYRRRIYKLSRELDDVYNELAVFRQRYGDVQATKQI